MDDSTGLKNFIQATGGGGGNYSEIYFKHRGGQFPILQRFSQLDRCKEVQISSSENQVQGLGFGRISFKFAPHDPKLYLRIPKESNPQMTLLFFESVWKLSRPKLIMSITGGAMDFSMSTKLQMVLNDLMEIARNTDAWIITGGTRAGIMKHFGPTHGNSIL